MILKATEVIKEVNLWAEEEANGLIKEIITPNSVDNLTKLIFANAMYFKGTWTEKFDTSVTEDSDFYLLNGSSVKVPFMTTYGKRFIGDFDDFKVLCLPYNKGEDERQFSMYIFLPNAMDGLSTLVEKLASEFELLEHNLPLIEKVEVGEFKIPRFNISFGIETTDTMKELGVILPFSSLRFYKNGGFFFCG